MKKGKIILGAAAFIVTAASALAFKTASKFNAGARLFGTAKVSGVTSCLGLTCFTNTNGLLTGANSSCHWNTSAHHLVGANVYTQATVAQHHCVNKWNLTGKNYTKTN